MFINNFSIHKTDHGFVVYFAHTGRTHEGEVKSSKQKIEILLFVIKCRYDGVRVDAGMRMPLLHLLHALV
jgi:hypothetical protein